MNNIVRFISILICLVVQSSVMLSQTIFVSGDINSNTTWSADTVKIVGDVTVGSGIVLTVSPGTYIEAQGYFRISVSGRIRAIGTVVDTIIFTVHDTSGFWQDTTSVSGGWAGVRLINNSSSDTSVFKYCKFLYGKKCDFYGGDNKGGAIYAINHGALHVANSLFNSNMAASSERNANDGDAAGGAIYCKMVGRVKIEASRFIRNRSFNNGGAVFIDTQCRAEIDDNTFLENVAKWWRIILPSWIVTGGGGGAIYTRAGFDMHPIISNNACFNNRTVTGVLYTSNMQGGIYNNTICNNEGVGIFDGHMESMINIYNNTVVNNLSFHGGIEIFSKARLYNNIGWGNGLYSGDMRDQINVSQATAGFELFNNCVQFGNGGPGMVDQYPEFVDPTNVIGISLMAPDADWSLADSSPCINHGTPDTTGLFIPESDIAGNPRIYGGRIEIGSYENQNVWVGIADTDQEKNRIIVYPNPGISQLNIESDQPVAYIELMNIYGQVVLQEKIQNGINCVNTEYLPPDIYLFRLFNYESTIVGSGKWLKR